MRAELNELEGVRLQLWTPDLTLTPTRICAASLQHRANQLGLDTLNAEDPLAAEPLIEIYDQTFQSGLQVGCWLHRDHPHLS